MATPKQIAANQKNARNSTGPQTIEGKLVVSQNAIRHGLLSKRLIIPGLEQEKEWKAHCQRIMESLSPVGGLEITLAGRIVINLWRLNRVMRYEAEQIRIAQESAVETVAQKRKYKGIFGEGEIPKIAQNPEDAKEWAESAWEHRRILTKFLTSQDEEVFANSEVNWFLPFVYKQIRKPFQIPADVWPPKQEGFKTWKRSDILKVLEWLCRHDEQDFAQLVKNLENLVNEDFQQSQYHAQEAAYELDVYKREHSFPPQGILDPICRYESHLQRAYQRDLEALQRLQAARKGNHPPLSPVIDVEVAPAESK